MKKFYLFSIIILEFLSCSGEAENRTITEKTVNGSIMTVCLYDTVTKTIDLPLSSLVSDCKLIQFENIDEALFVPRFATITDKYIGISQS